ncbi:unnamed protein product [Nesidiocoris tenuis]|uniref:Uncharacterized protein n=1 Tax=Nesidiocoris tenuis TaxID=355587 RepID=A0A6H5G653_9HEMI|nr:unnamed protein product [Nesidiocoris tenuis]CAB0003535.1 unnamed protein product [Nesidiocoris tenuis]
MFCTSRGQEIGIKFYLVLERFRPYGLIGSYFNSTYLASKALSKRKQRCYTFWKISVPQVACCRFPVGIQSLWDRAAHDSRHLQSEICRNVPTSVSERHDRNSSC